MKFKNFRRVPNAITKYLQQHNLPSYSLRVLFYGIENLLGSQPVALTADDVAAALGIDRGSAGRGMKDLVRRGLWERKASGHKKFLYFFSPKFDLIPVAIQPQECGDTATKSVAIEPQDEKRGFSATENVANEPQALISREFLDLKNTEKRKIFFSFWENYPHRNGWKDKKDVFEASYEAFLALPDDLTARIEDALEGYRVSPQGKANMIRRPDKFLREPGFVKDMAALRPARAASTFKPPTEEEIARRNAEPPPSVSLSELYDAELKNKEGEKNK